MKFQLNDSPVERPFTCSLTDEDLTGDIERIISKTVTPFVDASNPMLHYDELQAECRAKLAKIIHNGCLTRCPTRGKMFAFVKTSFRNHVNSLVQKHAFSAKRTGVKPAARRSLGTVDQPPAKKVQIIHLDDPENEVQLGRDDQRLQQYEFIEELYAQLSPPECAELDAFMREEPARSPGNKDVFTGCEQPSQAERKARSKLLRKCRAILMAQTTEKP